MLRRAVHPPTSLRRILALAATVTAASCGSADDEAADTSGSPDSSPATDTSSGSGADDESPAGTTPGGDPSTGADDDEGSTAPASDGATGSEGSAGTDAGTVDGSESGSTGGPADLCASDPGDTACYACAKQMCCDDYAACAADPDCLCAVDCTLAGGDPFGCVEQCGNPRVAPAMNLGICLGTTCAGDCTGGR